MDPAKELTVPAVKIRSFSVANALEIKCPDGKTLVTDPCLIKEGGPFACGYGAEDLEGCDYVFLNHSHSDHAESLGEVYDRFHPLILAHVSTCYALAKRYDIPYVRFIPFSNGDEYDFDSFRIKILPGRHNNQTPGNFYVRPSGRRDEFCDPGDQRMPPPMGDELDQELMNKGTMYGNNFLMTLPNNFRIGFFAGNPGFTEPQERNLWKTLHPDLLFSQRAKFDAPDYAETMADALEVTGARILVPMHIEDAYSGRYDPAEYIRAINEVCERRDLPGRAIFFERGKWYQISTGITRI